MTFTLNDKFAQLKAASSEPKGITNKKSLFNQVIQKASSLQRKDIDKWRKAMQRAMNPKDPRRDQLMDLYLDVMLDNHITGIWEHSRKDRLFAQDFQLVNSEGVVDKELTEAFKGTWFHDLIGHALDSRMYGFSLMEVEQVIPNVSLKGIDLLPRTHVVPERNIILKDLSGTAGFDYTKEPFVLAAGSKQNLGLLLKAAPMFLYKKGAMMAWSEYCEIFGMPLMVGTTNSQDKEDVARLMREMGNLGSAARAVFQEGENIEFKGDTKTDTYNIYDKHIERNNSELSKLILGSTGTTDMSKGAKAQAEVHERVGDDVALSDQRFISGWCNDTLLPFLANHGWSVDGLKFEFPETKGILELWARTKDALPYYEMDIEWLKDQFGLEVTGAKSGAAAQEQQATSLKLKMDELYHNHFK